MGGFDGNGPEDDVAVLGEAIRLECVAMAAFGSVKGKEKQNGKGKGKGKLSVA